MNKQELIDMLNELPDEEITFLVSSDEEGNSYRKANFGGEIEYAVKVGGWEWEVLHPSDVDDFEPDEIVKVAVFW